MKPAHTTVEITRDFDISADALFAHWVSPKTRLRWEAGPDTGMKYDAFDTRSGGREIVRIFEGGAEIGRMVQSVHVVEPGDHIATSIEATFDGVVTMLMQTTVQFERTKNGTRLNATCQIADLKGRDQSERHKRGWEWIFDRFAADIADHGLVSA